MVSFFRRRPAEMVDPYGDRPSRFSLFWQRQKILVRRLGIMLLVLILLAGTGWLAWFTLGEATLTSTLRARLAAMDPLRIQHIIITGRRLTDESEVLDALGTGVGHSLLGVSVEDARKRINALPFVDRSTVERHLPDTITITLEEKHPVAIWQVDGHFTLINQNGDRVSSQELTARNSSVFRKMPLVVGQGANLEAGAILDLLRQFPDINSHMIALIRIGQRRWNILMQNGTLLLLPEGAEAQALARLHAYQGSFQLLDRPLRTIDMRLPDRMVIHPAAPASDQGTPAPPPPPTGH